MEARVPVLDAAAGTPDGLDGVRPQPGEMSTIHR